MNIKEFYQLAEQDHLLGIQRTKEKQQACKEEITGKQKSKTALVQERSEKKRRMTEAEEEGLDASKLKLRIEELNDSISKLDAEIAELQQTHDKLDKIVPREFEREKLLSELVYDVYKIGAVTEAESLTQIIQALPVKIKQVDDAGRPTRCAISVDHDTTIELNIKGARHFVKNAKPAALKWLPNFEINEEGHYDEDGKVFVNLAVDWTKEPKLRAFFDKTENKFVLSDTELSYGVRRTRPSKGYGYQQEEYTETVTEDFIDLCVSLKAIVTESVEAEKGELDLDGTYTNNALMEHVQARVVQQTTTTPLFKPCREQLSSPQIWKEIKDHWQMLANANWSEEIGGSLALLKFYAEKKEEVRFWSKVFDGHYGFRLRTRDHDWIAGEIFISPSTSSNVTCKEIKIVKTGSGSDRYGNERNEPWVAAIGRMHLYVQGATTRR